MSSVDKPGAVTVAAGYVTIILANVAAYFIFLTFVVDAPAEIVIFSTYLSLFLVDALLTRFETRPGVRYSPAAILLDRRSWCLAPYGKKFFIGAFGYNICFWYGFTNLGDNAGLVLSLMALSVCITPFVVRDIEPMEMLPSWSLLIAVVLFVSAGFLFTLDVEHTELVEAIANWELDPNFAYWAVPLILAAVGFEAFQDREQTKLYHACDNKQTNPEILLYMIDERERKSILYSVSYAMHVPFALVMSLILLLVRGYQSDFWAADMEPIFGPEVNSIRVLCGYIVFSLIFVALGVAIRNRYNSRLRAAKMRPEVLSILLAMRPIVFFLFYPLIAFLLVVSGCADTKCVVGDISISNGFASTYPSDAIAAIVVLLAGCLLFFFVLRKGVTTSGHDPLA